MTLIRGGPAGPDTEDALGLKNLVEDDRAALWASLGGVQGIRSGFDHSLLAGQLGHEFAPGSALVEERDASGNLGLGRGYHLFSDATFQVLHEAPDPGSRNDAVVFAYVDIEDGAIGPGVSQSGPQVVVVKGTSGVVTPLTDVDITAALGRGGWFRYADVVIDPADTEVDPANVTAAPPWTRPRVSLRRAAAQAIAHATVVPISFDTADEDRGFNVTLPDSTITIPVDGLYDVRAVCALAWGIVNPTDNSSLVHFVVMKNGVEHFVVFRGHAASVSPTVGGSSKPIRFVAGDTLGLAIFHLAGSSRDTYVAAPQYLTTLSAAWVAP